MAYQQHVMWTENDKWFNDKNNANDKFVAYGLLAIKERSNKKRLQITTGCNQAWLNQTSAASPTASAGGVDEESVVVLLRASPLRASVCGCFCRRAAATVDARSLCRRWGIWSVDLAVLGWLLPVYRTWWNTETPAVCKRSAHIVTFVMGQGQHDGSRCHTLLLQHLLLWQKVLPGIRSQELPHMPAIYLSLISPNAWLTEAKSNYYQRYLISWCKSVLFTLYRSITSVLDGNSANLFAGYNFKRFFHFYWLKTVTKHHFVGKYKCTCLFVQLMSRIKCFYVLTTGDNFLCSYVGKNCLGAWQMKCGIAKYKRCQYLSEEFNRICSWRFLIKISGKVVLTRCSWCARCSLLGISGPAFCIAMQYFLWKRWNKKWWQWFTKFNSLLNFVFFYDRFIIMLTDAAIVIKNVLVNSGQAHKRPVSLPTGAKGYGHWLFLLHIDCLHDVFVLFCDPCYSLHS